MPKAPFGDILQYLRSMYPAEDAGDRTDGELLNRFVTMREEGAFTVLVQRHGPMVLGVCQRLLGDLHLAEDAFQATFIVLARRAASIGWHRSVGNWLYAVAQRVAMKAKAKTALRRNRERESGNMPRAERLDEHTWQELRSIIDEEIGRLPEKYQAPLVLCHLEGKSHDRAAKELGCAKTTLERRLSRGRELLHQQFIKRGITLSAGMLATVLCEKVAAAPLGATLTFKAVKAAALAAGGKGVAAGFLTARALALAEEALAGMVGLNAKLAVMVLAAGLAVGGAGWAGYGGLGEKSQQAPLVKAPSPTAVAQVVAPEKKPSFDQYGDTLPEGAVARLGTLRFRHEGEATALAFTPDGNSLIGNTNAFVVIWDTASGKERYRLPRPIHFDLASRGSDGLGVSPDGKTLALPEFTRGEEETKIGLWELSSGKKTRILALPKDKGRLGQIGRLCFTPDGKGLAMSYTTDGKTIIFDLTSGLARASVGGEDAAGGRRSAYNFAISPDSKTLAVAIHPDPKHGVQLWDIATEKFVRAIHDLPARSGESFVRAMAFSSDGKVLAFGIEDRIILSDPATGKTLRQLEAKMGQITDLAFTPDGHRLVSASESDGKVRVWNLADGKTLQVLDGRMSIGRSMALARDGKTVALGTVAHTVQLWDVDTGKELFAEYDGHKSQINSVVFSPDGKTIVSGGDYRQTLIWDTATWQRRGSLPMSGRTSSFSPDGKYLATVPAAKGYRTTKVAIWDVSASKETLVITVPEAQDVKSAIFSPDGRKLFTLDWKYERPNWYRVRHWNAGTGELEQTWAIPHKTYELSLGSDGKTILAVPEDKVISMYNAELGRERFLHSNEKESMTCLTYSPDAMVLAYGMWDGQSSAFSKVEHPVFRVLEVTTGREIYHAKGIQGCAGPIAWSRDARLVAFQDAGGDPYTRSVTNTVRILDMGTGKEVKRFGGYQTAVTALTFSHDGRFLVAGMSNSTILVWEVAKVSSKPAPGLWLDKEALEERWNALMADNAGDAHQALWSLVISSKEGVHFLRGRLKPVPAADQAKITQWITDLDSEKFAVRQTAVKELEKIGDQVQVPIRKALKGSITLEVRRRLEQILKTLADIPGPETVRTIRAIMALERIGSSEAQGVLEALARGAPGARETEEAKGSLDRLKLRASRMP